MPRVAHFDHAAVAGLVDAARARKVPTTPHVAAALGVDEATARNAVCSARRAGFVTPIHMVPKTRRGVTPGLALRCADCPKAYPVDGLLDLLKHVRREHARTASNLERTPRT